MTKTAISGVPFTPEEAGMPPRPRRALAMAYVPVQRFEDLADAKKGLDQGTVFNQLVKPLECGLKRRALR